MKLNLSLLVLALACMSVAHAQTEKGTKTLGFSVNYAKEKNDRGGEPERKTTSFGLGPSFSYFMKDKLEIGASLNYFNSDYEFLQQNNYMNGLKDQQFGATIFLQKHFMFSEQFGIRTGPFASFINGNSESDYPDQPKQETTSKGFRTGLNLGIEYFPVKSIGIAANLATLSYNHMKQEVKGTTETNSKINSFELDVTNGLNLSIFFVFGAK